MLEGKILHELDVLLESVVEIVGNCTGLVVINEVREGGEVVPNVWTFAGCVPSSFDLIGGCCCSPSEFGWEFYLGGREGAGS